MLRGAPAAALLNSLLAASLGPGLPVRLRAWDGSEAGPAGAPTLVVNSRRALRRLLWQPNEVGLVRGFASGELDVEGDLYALLRAYTAAKRQGRAATAHPVPRRTLLVTALRLGALGPPPPRPAEEARLGGRLHSRSRDRAAVSHHYDVGNDFYRLLLGPSLVYSCAYWRRPPSPSYTLEDAQRDKLELVCRKLALRPGMRILDVGCGWGSFSLHAAAEHGVDVVGITLSTEQQALARKRVAEAGLADRVEIRLQDYRDVPDGPYDAIASIAMAEQVGTAKYAEYCASLFDLLREGGRLLNHQIVSRPGDTEGAANLISSYIFPDGELIPVGTVCTLLEQAGFEVRDVEALREHYALTLRPWVDNLEEHWAEAVRATSAARARIWRLYLAGSALGFETGLMGVSQVLAVKPCPDGRSLLPLVRLPGLEPA